jgi:hypothetical protein
VPDLLAEGDYGSVEDLVYFLEAGTVDVTRTTFGPSFCRRRPRRCFLKERSEAATTSLEDYQRSLD